MEQLIDILRFSSIFLLVLIIVLLFKSNGRRRDIWAMVAFIFSIVSYLIVDWNPFFGHPLYFIFLAPTFAVPIGFWIFSKALFDDTFQWKQWMLWVALIVIGINYIIHFQCAYGILNLDEGGQMLLILLQKVISLLFIILAIMEALRNREADLILSRLKFRNVYIILSATVMIITLLGEIAFPKDNAPLFLELLQKTVIAGLAFYFAINRFEFKTGFFRVQEPSGNPPISSPPELDQGIMDQLLDLMEQQKIYRKEGLTIRKLAEMMKVKEYKLRQTINQHLNFRNFNEFLNSYRIQDACTVLKDHSKKEVTILEIAYEMGYQSLAPFNKAFKEKTGMTPTEYKKSS